jgi:dUTP pyrophosphatase
MSTVIVKKIDQNAKIPSRSTYGSAGYDLFALGDTVLAPGVNIVQTGISLCIPIGMYGRIAPRSSLGIMGIDIFAGVVDNDYNGEIKVIMFNTKNVNIKINCDKAIAQVIFERIALPQMIESDSVTSKSMHLGFGSTDKN